MYIPVEAVNEVRARIKSYNQKWNANVTCEVEEPVAQTTTSSDGKKTTVMMCWVELKAPRVKTAREGVELLEIVSIKDGVDHVSFQGTENYIPYRKDECDHCHSKRKRNLYYIVRYNGEVKQVGSGCVKEYLGESIYSVFTGFYKLVGDLEEISEKGLPGSRPVYYESILDIAKAVYQETNGFSKWTSAKYGIGTSEQVKINLSHGKYQLESEYSFLEEDQKDFVQHILHNKNGGNEMSLNICWACLDRNNCLNMFVPFSSAGTCAWAIYEFYKSKKEGKIEQEKKAISLRPISDKVGESVSLEGEVRLLRTGENNWGSTYFEYMVSDGERCAAWFTSKKLKEGRAKVTGKVKGTWYKKEGFCTLLGGRVKVEPFSEG